MAATLQLTAYEVANSTDLVANTSRLFVQLDITTTLGTYNHSGDTTGSITVNGQSFSLNGLAVDKNTTTTLYKKTHTVPHNPDGSKTVTVAAVFDPNTPATKSMSLTKTVQLTAIPRASTLAATDGTIGSVSMLAVNRRSSSYTHTIFWSFGTLSGYLAEDGSLSDAPVQLTQTAQGFLLPEAFYNEIPNSPKGTCTLTCTTYAQGVQVGQPQSTSFTVTADPSLCGPQGSLTVVDSNPVTLALTGDAAQLVRYGSNVLCTLTANARCGASVAQRTIAGTAISGDVLVLPAFSGDQVSCSVTDSRGFRWETNQVCQQVDYIPLTANLTCGRTDPTSGRARVTVRGNYFDGSFGAQSNQLQIRCTVADQEQTLTPTLGEGTYEATGEFSGLDYRSSHSLTLTVADGVVSHTLTATIGRGVPVFDWGEGDFRFQVPVTVPEPTQDDQAMNRGYGVAKAGDTMTGNLRVPQVLTTAGFQVLRADGSVKATMGSGDMERVYLSNRKDGVSELFYTPAFTQDRTQTGQFYLLTTKSAVTVAQGGTGAATAAAARKNLGIGYTKILSTAVDTVGVEQKLTAGYGAYLFVGEPSSGSSLVTMLLPMVLLTESAVRYQLADNVNYCAFDIWLSSGVPVIKKTGGSGAITAVFGIN